MTRYLSILFFLLLTGLSFGQRDRILPNQGGNAATGDTLIIVGEDTLSNDVYAYSLDDLSTKTYFNDTTLFDFEEYEISRLQDVQFFHLGNPGSASAPLFWNQQYNDRFNLGFNQHQLYKLQDSDIRFYQIEKPYSDVYFSPGASQASFRAKAILARDFAHGVKVSLRYNRINSESIYPSSEVRHTNFHLGMYQRIDSSRWAYSVNFLSNSNYEDIYGGLTNQEQLYILGGDARSTLDIRLPDVYTYSLSRDYSARAYYFIKDEEENKSYFQLRMGQERSRYKFINEDITPQDTAVFGESRIVSELGMRRPIQHVRSSVQGAYHIENKRFRNRYWFRYALNQVSSDLTNRGISEIVAGTENAFQWKGLELNLDGFFGTTYGAVLLDFYPKASYEIDGVGALDFGFRIHTEPSGYQWNNLEITFVELENKDAFTISSQEIYGSLAIPEVGLKARVSSYAGQNIPVLDTTGTSVTPISIAYLQVDIQEDFKYKWFHFDNQFVTQLGSNSVYSMPQFYTRHKLYLVGKLFHALNFQSGISADFAPAYSVPAYSPLYTAFYDSKEDPSRVYYRLDVFASIKVQGFRFFAKYENLNGLWDEEVLFQVADYPQLDGRFRLGISWTLRD
jgi:hypothetical protein